MSSATHMLFLMWIAVPISGVPVHRSVLQTASHMRTEHILPDGAQVALTSPSACSAFEKSRSLAEVMVAAGHEDTAPLNESTPIRIYIGSSNKTMPGFISTIYNEDVNAGFDVTNPLHYQTYICNATVDGFFSEHTFEHIAYDAAKRGFALMRGALRPGGVLRTAIPSFDSGHQPSQLDELYGHVAFYTQNMLMDALRVAGFQKVSMVEYREYGAHNRSFQSFISNARTNDGYGLVNRSFWFDPRNQIWHDLLGRRSAPINITAEIGSDGNLSASRVFVNGQSVEIEGNIEWRSLRPPTVSTIIDAVVKQKNQKKKKTHREDKSV